MELLLVLPLIIPLLAAVASLFAWRWLAAQRVLGVVGTGGLLTAGLALLYAVREHGIQAVQVGAWPAPFGITLVADLFSAIMVVLAGLMGFAVAVYSLVTVDELRKRFGYFPLMHLLLMGVSGAFLTGDIFNLYVWFEVLLIASFVLLTLGGEPGQLEGGIKYVTLNLISSALFLTAVGILYGTAGTLNMADLALTLGNTGNHGLVTTLAVLFLVAFGIKAAAFPLFFWLPASYHTPPVAVSAIFAGLLTKVGVYALIRVFTLLFVQDVGYTHTLILVVAGATMVTGVLGAVAQNEFRRILSFHIVSQIGYMLMGLGLFTSLALAGSVFYIIHHIIVKTTLFLVSGAVYRMRGTYDLKELGGLYRTAPAFGVLFLIPALSLAGLPPLSGFFAKLVLVRAGLETHDYLIVGTALAVSLLTLFSMTKIWNEVFWKAAPELPEPADPAEPPGERRGGMVALVLPIAVLAALTVLIGVAVGPVFDLAAGASEQLLDRTEYIEAVLGGQPSLGFLWNVLLALAWAAVTGEFTAENLVLGGVLGFVVLLFTRRAVGASTYVHRVRHGIGLALFFLWELALANLRVASTVLSPRPKMRPGVIAVPLDARSDAEITLLANLITLTPGTLSLDVSANREILYIHTMYVENGDLEAVRWKVKDGFERRVIEMLR